MYVLKNWLFLSIYLMLVGKRITWKWIWLVFFNIRNSPNNVFIERKIRKVIRKIEKFRKNWKCFFWWDFSDFCLNSQPYYYACIFVFLYTHSVIEYSWQQYSETLLKKSFSGQLVVVINVKFIFIFQKK